MQSTPDSLGAEGFWQDISSTDDPGGLPLGFSHLTASDLLFKQLCLLLAAPCLIPFFHQGGAWPFTG